MCVYLCVCVCLRLTLRKKNHQLANYAPKGTAMEQNTELRCLKYLHVWKVQVFKIKRVLRFCIFLFMSS